MEPLPSYSPIIELINRINSLEEAAASNDKVISTNLTIDSKPSKTKLRILSFLTFFIYPAIYNYKHDRKRVFKKITDEINTIMKNYHLQLDSRNVLSENEKKDLEAKNKNLNEIKANIQNNIGDNFLDKQYFTSQNVELEALAMILYKKALSSRYRPSDFQTTILERLKKEYKAKKNPSIEESFAYSILETLSPDNIILLPIDFQNKALKYNFSLKIDSTKNYDIEGSMTPLPIITNGAIIEEIDKIILANSKQLDPEIIKLSEEKDQQTVANDKQEVTDLFNKAAAFVTTLWEKSKDAKKNEITVNENIELLQLKARFMNEIDTQKNINAYLDSRLI